MSSADPPDVAAVLRAIRPRTSPEDIDPGCCPTCFEAWRKQEDLRDWRVVHEARALADRERRRV